MELAAGGRTIVPEHHKSVLTAGHGVFQSYGKQMKIESFPGAWGQICSSSAYLSIM